MERDSITIVFPVYNQQDRIVSKIETMIDWMIDLCSETQLIVVDDGSTDATAEILDDLRLRYPQILSFRNRHRLGAKRSVESGLTLAAGSFVFLHESYDAIDRHAVAQLWKLRHDRDLVVARTSIQRKRIDDALLQQLSAWGKEIEENRPLPIAAMASETSKSDTPTTQLQMVRREGMTKLGSDANKRVDGSQSPLEVSHLSHRRFVRAKSI